MAYGLKYYSEFTDAYGAACRLNIAKKNYVGASTEIELAADPVVIEREAEKVLSPLLTMGCTINVWSNTNFQYEELFLAAPREYLVSIVRKGNVIFIGYIEPGLYSEDFVAPPYVITISATDHLKSLENYNPAAFLIFAKSDLLTIIKTCLAEAFDLPINICCTIFAAAHTVSATSTLFEQSLIDNEGLTETKDGVVVVMSAKDLLEKIMTSFGCRIYQAKGEWFIDRIRNRARDSSTYVRIDTSNGVTVVTYDQTVALGSDDAPWYSTPSMEVEVGYASQVVKQDLATPETLIHNNFSSGFIYYVAADATEKWFRNNEYYHLEPFTSLYGIAMGFSFLHTIVGKLQSVYQSVECSAYQGDTISVKFMVAISATAGTVTKKVTIPYSIFVNTDYFVNKDGVVVPCISSTEWKILKELDVTEDFEGNLTTAIEVAIETKGLSSMAGTQDDSKIKLVLYPAESTEQGADITKSHYGDIKVVVDTNHKPTNTYTAKNTKGFWKKADEIDLKINDAPASVFTGGSNYRNVKNILVREETVNAGGGTPIYVKYPPLVQWYDSEVELAQYHGKQLAEQLLQDAFAQYYDSRAKLSGEVDSDIDISPVNLFTVEDRYGRFLMLADRYNVQAATHALTVEAVANIPIDLL